jgi:hypothetical protein
MKITQLIIFCIVAYFLFFKKEGYSYIELPSTCSKEDPGLMCKDKRGRYISLTSSSAKDCDEKTPEVQCKDNMGNYQRLSRDRKLSNQQNQKISQEQSKKIINDFMSQVKTDIQQPQIQRGDTTCNTLNPSYSCNINGILTTVSPTNAKNCRGSLECRNNMGTFTKLTKEQSDKVIKDFMSQVKTDIQQPVFDEEYSKKARRCKIPLEERISNGVTLCRNDLPGNESSFIQKPKPSPSNYIRLSEL